jgi:hypothetical protein
MQRIAGVVFLIFSIIAILRMISHNTLRNDINEILKENYESEKIYQIAENMKIKVNDLDYDGVITQLSEIYLQNIGAISKLTYIINREDDKYTYIYTLLNDDFKSKIIMGDSTADSTTNGDSTDGDSTNGDSTDASTTNGDSTDGDTANGDTTNGDSTTDASTTNVSTTNGSTGDASTTDASTTNGDSTGGDTANGSTANGEVVNGDNSHFVDKAEDNCEEWRREPLKNGITEECVTQIWNEVGCDTDDWHIDNFRQYWGEGSGRNAYLPILKDSRQWSAYLPKNKREICVKGTTQDKNVPCEKNRQGQEDNNENISLQCYKQIWKEAGCTTDLTENDLQNKLDSGSFTLNDAVSDSQMKSDVYNRDNWEKCYGIKIM